MKTLKSISKKYLKIHDQLTEGYYEHKEYSKSEFKRLHQENWQAMDAELIAEGFIQEPSAPMEPINLQILVKDIETMKERLNKLESIP